MSIPVPLADLADALEGFGTGYVLTTTAGQVKAIAVVARAEAAKVRVVNPGRGTAANVAENPNVTLLFPPTGRPGFTLLVDGTAQSDGVDVVVSPTWAVLHRPAT